MIFVSLKKSDRGDKKYVIVFKEPNTTIHFGSKNSRTYLDHGNKTVRENYIKRHRVNEDWSKINAGSLSRYLLWGDTTDINKNLKSYLKRMI
jgi:hypothetical protein